MTCLSAVIATKNEEKHISELLAQLNWMDEIVVVDMFSTDRAVEIARGYTDKIFQHNALRELLIVGEQTRCMDAEHHL